VLKAHLFKPIHTGVRTRRLLQCKIQLKKFAFSISPENATFTDKKSM